MTANRNPDSTNVETTDYSLALLQVEALIADEKDPLANTANFVALLHDAMPRTNWTGVYLLRGDELVLGPFQGKPACTRISVGAGVCGAAARDEQTQRVDDVHAFDGHIACDPVSRSELVVPLNAGDRLIGVLDIDSPDQARFTEGDQRGVEAICRAFEAAMGTERLRALVGA